MAMSAEEKAHKASKRRLRREYNRKVRSRKPRSHYLITFLAIFMGVGCIASIISDKIEYSEKERELEALKLQAAALEAENASYQSILDEDDERTYMERIASEKLGYAYPDERRFYDTTRN
ncbi:MAG: septum formation initiator family protein [Huintestinicola sp.]